MGDEEVTPVFLSGEQTCWGLSHPCLYSPLSCRDPAVQMEPPGRPSDPPLGWAADPSTVCRVVRLTFKHLMLRKEWKNLTSSLWCLLLVWDELVKNNIFLWSLMKTDYEGRTKKMREKCEHLVLCGNITLSALHSGKHGWNDLKLLWLTSANTETVCLRGKQEYCTWCL